MKLNGGKLWTVAGLLAILLLIFGAAACGAAEEEEAVTTEDAMEEDVDDSMAAEDTMEEEVDDSMATEDTMDEDVDDSMAAEEPEDVIEEGEYVAKPVVGEIFIESASEINEDNIFQGPWTLGVDGRSTQPQQYLEVAGQRLHDLGH